MNSDERTPREEAGEGVVAGAEKTRKSPRHAEKVGAHVQELRWWAELSRDPRQNQEANGWELPNQMECMECRQVSHSNRSEAGSPLF